MGFVRGSARLLVLALVCLVAAMPVSAQVLARPGWAGSGVAPEAWWLRAVFYRLDPVRFQDSDGDGKGDLAGVIERLDYLQSLGVDALVLDGELAGPGDLSDLVREASRHQLRVLLRLPASGANSAAMLKTAAEWMSEGVAGVWLPKAAPDGAEVARYAETVTAVRSLMQHYPGDRVLLTEPAPVSLRPAPVSLRPAPVSLRPAPVSLEPAPLSLRSARRINPGSFNAAREGQLVLAAVVPVDAASATAERSAVMAIAGQGTGGAGALLRAGEAAAVGVVDTLPAAVTLMLSRGAVMFDAGEELGLALSGKAEQVASLPVMQWTPGNVTRAPSPEAEGSGAAGSATEFGAFHPYQPPPRSLLAPSGAAPRVIPDANLPVALPAPDTLPGFTSGRLPAGAPAFADRSATVQDREPGSTLNRWRQLIALHHGNAAVRNGSQQVLTVPEAATTVWVRRAPTGSRTAANVVAAVNLEDRGVTLDLDRELEAGGMRGGLLRPLFASSAAEETGETTGRLLLPAHGAFAGEIFHGGVPVREPARAHCRGRRQRGSRGCGLG